MIGRLRLPAGRRSALSADAARLRLLLVPIWPTPRRARLVAAPEPLPELFTLVLTGEADSCWRGANAPAFERTVAAALPAERAAGSPARGGELRGLHVKETAPFTAGGRELPAAAPVGRASRAASEQRLLHAARDPGRRAGRATLPCQSPWRASAAAARSACCSTRTPRRISRSRRGGHAANAELADARGRRAALLAARPR